MTVTEQLVAAMAASNADPGRKAVVEEFLKEAGPIIETLGPSVFQQLMASAASGAVPQQVVESLNEAQVAALVAQADGDMTVLAASHEAQAAAWSVAWAQLETAALAAVAGRWSGRCDV